MSWINYLSGDLKESITQFFGSVTSYQGKRLKGETVFESSVSEV